MDLGLQGQVYVVTGGSGGLGLATATALVADGARVVLSGRHAESVERAVDELGATHATGLVADNADPGTPRALVEAARSTYGRLDGALVSVGGPAAGTIMDTPDEDWAAAIESVFLGGLRLGREIGRELGAGRLDRLRAVLLGEVADRRAGHLQRPPPRPGDDRQDPRRRARARAGSG